MSSSFKWSCTVSFECQLKSKIKKFKQNLNSLEVYLQFKFAWLNLTKTQVFFTYIFLMQMEFRLNFPWMACMQNKMAASGISVLPNRRICVVISRGGERSLSRLKYISCNKPAPQTYTDRAFYHEDPSYLCLRHLCRWIIMVNYISNDISKNLSG